MDPPGSFQGDSGSGGEYLPAPDGPMMEMTSLFKTHIDLMKNGEFAINLHNIFHFNKAHRSTSSVFINGIAFFNVCQNLCQDSRAEQVENSCYKERRCIEVALNESTGDAHEVVHSKNVYKRGILQKRDGFVAKKAG